jgi:hypothetical protein
LPKRSQGLRLYHQNCLSQPSVRVTQLMRPVEPRSRHRHEYMARERGNAVCHSCSGRATFAVAGPSGLIFPAKDLTSQFRQSRQGQKMKNVRKKDALTVRGSRLRRAASLGGTPYGQKTVTTIKPLKIRLCSSVDECGSKPGETQSDPGSFSLEAWLRLAKMIERSAV